MSFLRHVSLRCAIFAVLVFLFPCVTAYAAYSSYDGSIATYQDFRNGTNNTIGYDADGYYDRQCWDGVQILYKRLGMSLSTGGQTYAKYCWLNENARNTNTGNQFIQIININDVRRGDIIVFDQYSSSSPYGHIGFADENNNTSKSTITVWGQNQSGNGNGYYFTAKEYAKSRFLGAFRYKGWSDNEKPIITAAYITNATPFGYNVVCSVSDDMGLSNIQIGTWNDVIGIDQAVWQSQNVNGNNADVTFHVDISAFNNQQNTTYHSNVFVWDTSGNISEGIRAGDIMLEMEAPRVTEAHLENITVNGYDVVCSVSDNVNLSNIQIGTWNDVIGIDQAVWQSQNVSGSNADATFHVDISDFSYQQNTVYYSNVFVSDASGNVSEGFRAGDIMLETEIPCVTVAYIENLTPRGYDVVFTAVDNVGVIRATIGTWNDDIGIDAAKWKNFTVDSFPCRIHITIDDFSGLQNVAYHSNVYCFDRCGNISEARRVGDTIVPAMPNLSEYKVLRIPEGVLRIESEAFIETKAEIVIIPVSCQAIETRAFADCATLKYVILSKGTEVEIAEDAFAGSDTIVFMEE